MQGVIRKIEEIIEFLYTKRNVEYFLKPGLKKMVRFFYFCAKNSFMTAGTAFYLLR